MINIKRDAMQILAEVSMDVHDGDVIQSYKDIKLIDDLLSIVKAKSLINHSKGRKPKIEKRFEEIFRARILEASKDRDLLDRRKS